MRGELSPLVGERAWQWVGSVGVRALPGLRADVRVASAPSQSFWATTALTLVAGEERQLSLKAGAV